VRRKNKIKLTIVYETKLSNRWNEMTWMNIENLDQYEVLNWIEHIWIGVNINNTCEPYDMWRTFITSIAWKKKDGWEWNSHYWLS
jgi:hypothetical protein